MIFAPYADDLAARLADLRDGSVLETAAGTGVVTRALVSTLSRGVSIVATDLNQPMLDHAASQLVVRPGTGGKRTPRRCRSPMACSTRGVPVRGDVLSGQTASLRRGLARPKPGGRFLFSVWGRIEENEFADIVVRAVATLFRIRRCSWRARHMGTTTLRPWRRNSKPLGLGQRASRPSPDKAGRRARARWPSATVRARRCGTRSKPTVRRPWPRRPRSRPPRSLRGTAPDRSPAGSAPT